MPPQNLAKNKNLPFFLSGHLETLPFDETTFDNNMNTSKVHIMETNSNKKMHQMLTLVSITRKLTDYEYILRSILCCSTEINKNNDTQL